MPVPGFGGVRHVCTVVLFYLPSPHLACSNCAPHRKAAEMHLPMRTAKIRDEDENVVSLFQNIVRAFWFGECFQTTGNYIEYFRQRRDPAFEAEA